MNKSKAIQRELESRKSGHTGNEIAFDPQTGELMAVKPNQPRKSNVTVISDIADDGFAVNW